MTNVQAMTKVQAIREFFGEPKVTMDELKKLSKEERLELGELCAKELGVEIVEAP